MSYSPKSNPKMQQKSAEELARIIETGSLAQAAACYELHRRGLDSTIAKAKAARRRIA